MSLWNNQDWRINSLRDYTTSVYNEVAYLTKTYDIHREDAIKIVQVASNIQDGDFRDEQIVGIATKLIDIIEHRINTESESE